LNGAPLALLWRLGAASTLIVMASAMTGPVLAVLLQQAGYGTGAIGAFAMLAFLLVGLLMPVVPRVIGRLGLVRTYRCGGLLQLLGAIGYALSDHLVTWSASAVVTGIGASLLWNASETLLTQEAPPAMRGRVLGIYQTALGAALALGPFLPALLQLEARTALWLGAGLVGVCLLLAASARSRAVAAHPLPSSGGTWNALRAVPWLVALAFAGGVFEAGLSAISAAHASSLGMDLRTATSVAGAIGVGSFLFQYPAGWASDHMPVRRVFTSAALVLVLASAGIAFADRAPWLLWACGLLWGGVGGALYTLSIIEVAHAVSGRATAGGAAAMITGYTWGGALGPLVSGWMLQAAGLAGLAAWLFLLALGALAAARRLAPD
jgi:MFS family permease